MIGTKTPQVRELIAGGYKLEIPNYQRGYDWGKDEAEDFWEDLENGVNEGKPIFLGTIVLDISRRESKQIVSIVDGQQRLTTIMIFLAACRELQKSKRKKDLAITIQGRISFIDDRTGKTKGPILLTSDTIREVFDATIADYDWDGVFPSKKKRQVRRIKPIFEHFLSKIDNSDLKMSDILDVLYGSTFVAIEIQNTKEAFDIFERTNARGMELNAADLLKNYFFAQNASDDLEDRWARIIDNSTGNVARMLKYFWVSKFGYIQKKSLYESIRKYGNEIGASELLIEIDKFSEAYSVLVRGTNEDLKDWVTASKITELKREYHIQTLNEVFDALRLFKVTQGYPLIISTFFRIEESKIEDREKYVKRFLELVKTIEHYHFINNAICQRPGNEVEFYYADKSKEISKGEGNLNEIIRDIISDLQKKLASIHEFSERFRDLSYDPTENLRLIYYIFDRMNNYDRKGAEKIKIYDPDSRILKKNYTVEHLLSQNPSKSGLTKEEVADCVHSIGNLLVISYHLNSNQVEIGNKPIAEKMKALEEKQMQLPTVRNFIEEYKNYDWSNFESIREGIFKRAGELSKFAYEKVWRI